MISNTKAAVSNFFIVTSLLFIMNLSVAANEPNSLTIHFDENEARLWRPLNDGVMGGLSQGNIKVINNTAIFSGYVTTENNGGFSSVVRTSIDVPESASQVTLEVEGDGKDYQFRFIRYIDGYRVAYKQTFSTVEKQRQTIVFPFSDFVASYRGRLIPNAPILRPEDITQIGLMAAFKQPNSFELLIRKITLD